MKNIKSLLQVFFAIVFFGLIIVCAIRCSDPSEEDNPLPPDDPISVADQFTIDNLGGKFILPSGIIVTIPEGAVVKSQEIKVEILKLENANTLAPIIISENTTFLSGITISTNSFDFKKPIKLKIPVQNLDETGLPILYELQEGNDNWDLSKETIIVSVKEKYIEIVMSEAGEAGGRKNARTNPSLNEVRNFLINLYLDILHPEDPCKTNGRLSLVNESYDLDATEGKCKGVRILEKYTYLDCKPPISEVYEISKISPLCEPQFSISAPEEIELEESAPIEIIVSAGSIPLPEQEISVSANSKLSIVPSSKPTRSGGDASFQVTGIKAGDGQISGTVFFDYHLTTISASGNGETESHKYDPIIVEIDFEINILVKGLPLVSTSFSRDISETTAILGGEVTEDWDEEVTECGIYFNDEKIPLGDGLGSFETERQLLVQGTYKVKAYATNRFGTTYGEEKRFVVDIDGNIYPIVTIGEQEWITENLKTTRYNDGTSIVNIEDPSDWGQAMGTEVEFEGFYCWYENKISYRNDYGALYNWLAVEEGKLCPVGWHVPSAEEYLTLIEFVGGIDIGGGMLKETGTSHWKSPNTGATNEYGLTALPGGYRIGYHFPNYEVDFVSIGEDGVWWTSTLDPRNGGYYVGLSYDYQDAGMGNHWVGRGGSIRCVED